MKWYYWLLIIVLIFIGIVQWKKSKFIKANQPTGDAAGVAVATALWKSLSLKDKLSYKA